MDESPDPASAACRAPEGHAEIEALARDLWAALDRLRAGSVTAAPEVAAVALILDERVGTHLRAEEEFLFPAFDRLAELVTAVRCLRHEHEVLRLQTAGVRHLAARAVGGGPQAGEAMALLGPVAESLVGTLQSHAKREEDVTFPCAARFLGEDRLDLLMREMEKTERREARRDRLGARQ